MPPKRIIITGASSGIGRAVAERLSADGASVALTGRDHDRLAETATALGGVPLAPADVTQAERLAEALAELRAGLGGVDGVVACAGGTGVVDTAMDPGRAGAEWRRVVDQNLTGTFHTVLALARHLPRPGGRIVTLSSIAGTVGASTGSLAYAAAKAGVDGLTRALSAELGPQGIAVNAIAPGYVADTRFFGEGDQRGRRARFAELIPSGRIGRPGDIAALVAFLCSDEAEHIHGQVLHVNGGQHLAG